MEIRKKDDCIYIFKDGEEHKMIDNQGQLQLKEMHIFLCKCKADPLVQKENITFDDNVDGELQEGIKVFIKSLLSKLTVDVKVDSKND